MENKKKSYNKYVRTLIESVFVDINESKDVMILYRIAKDMGHASGYNFNASEGIVDSYCHKSMLYTWKLLKYFITNASETLKEHNEKCNDDDILSTIDSLISIETTSILDVYKRFNLKYD